jgi:hypothetical protein
MAENDIKNAWDSFNSISPIIEAQVRKEAEAWFRTELDRRLKAQKELLGIKPSEIPVLPSDDLFGAGQPKEAPFAGHVWHAVEALNGRFTTLKVVEQMTKVVDGFEDTPKNRGKISSTLHRWASHGTRLRRVATTTNGENVYEKIF